MRIVAFQAVTDPGGMNMALGAGRILIRVAGEAKG
jgi:hypothetical protein